LIGTLREWFVVRSDYRNTTSYPKPVNLLKLRSAHCLCGHWEVEGYHLNQRYPEILSSDRYRLITFVRDPLEIQLSLFNYEKKYNVNKTEEIEEFLQLRPNYIANIFPLERDNYRDILDKYYFIGILEYFQESINHLAELLGKPESTALHRNKSRQRRNERDLLSKELVDKFRQENELDYLIYEYCLSKFPFAHKCS